MKKTLLILSAIFLLSSLGCNKSSDQRRYQIATSTYGNGSVGIYMVDTYTGKTWFYLGNLSKNLDSNWSYIGAPAAGK